MLRARDYRERERERERGGERERERDVLKSFLKLFEYLRRI